MEPSNSTGTPSLRKAIGGFDGIFILLAVTIGAGIFKTPQEVALFQSSFFAIMVYWLVIGGIAYTGGLIYTELGSRVPVVGGTYAYLTHVYGRHVGFLYGWKSFFLTNPSTRAGLAIVCADYLGHFIHLTETAHTAVAIGAVLLAGSFNIVGVNWAVAFQKVTTTIKVLGLLGLVAIGLFAGHGDHSLTATLAPESDMGFVGNMAATALLVFFAYTGWGRLSYVAEEMKDARHCLKQGMVVGLGVLVALYLAVNYIYFRELGLQGVRESDAVASDTATQIIGSAGSGLVSVLVMLAVVGSMSVSVMSSSRLYYAMAKDRLFFSWLGQLHPRFQTPARAVIVHCGMATAMLLVRKNFVDLVTSAVFVNFMFYALKASTLFSLRRRDVGGETAFRMPLYPVLPIVYLASILFLVGARIVFRWDRAWFDLVILGIGAVCAVLWGRFVRNDD